MSNLSQIFPEKKERTDFWIAITVILLFLAAIVYYIFGPEKLNEVPGLATVNEVVEEGSGFSYETGKDTVYQTYDAKKGEEEELDALVESVEKDSVDVAQNAVSMNEEESTEPEEEEEEQKEEELPVYVDEDDPVQPTEKVEDTQQNETTPVEAETTPVEEEEPVVEVEEPAETPAVVPPVVEDKKDEVEKNNQYDLGTDSDDSPYGCIVIVGSFKEPKNAENLADTLEKEGHPVYEGAYKGYYVIGVNADCDRSTVLPLLKKLRAKHQPDAWIYKR